jgi:phospholipid/cholesterol/gamma-HCH transport system ATP-binding protein
VLHRVSFHVAPGQSYVVLGQSGVGKSVLLKIMAYLLPPDEGNVRIGTRDIGMLFQKNALFDSLTVHENLEFPLRERTRLKREERKERITKFLDWVGLPGTGKLFPDELSGGMQKRLGIARALIVEPRVLFYDEPTAGLDPITSRLIAELMLRLKRELGTTIVVVTSDVMRAYQLADRIGVLMRTPEGAVLAQAGSPDEARASKDPAIQQFLQGLTEGPLTSHEEVILPPDDPMAECAQHLERLDVDFF